ncbi:hypothetical protein [uncultured Nitrosomonas sp.]|uniref:alpha/beta fold hydrolase n=1 Tax=uncultured Nitrosomonas sp. TaxID=156424 RepID=UPI0025DE820C|nr:hypothetical protein [uncultured Nitrosomonas sp.]
MLTIHSSDKKVHLIPEFTYLSPTGAEREEKLWLTTTSGAKIMARVLVPSFVNPALPPLIALHGISRNADAIYAAFAASAIDTGRVLIVPRFSRAQWPIFQRIGRVRPDKAILTLITMLRSNGTIEAESFELFGFSGGAQLAHRFALLYPNLVSCLHLASSGWYCLPDMTLSYPAGLGQPARSLQSSENDLLARMRAQLTDYLRLPLSVYVGTADTIQNSTLRSKPRLNAVQGPHRLARAKSYVAHFTEAAKTHGIKPNARLILLDGCGHEFSQCAVLGGLTQQIFYNT